MAAAAADADADAQESSARNVQVAVRLRPMSARERLAGATEALFCARGGVPVVTGQPEHRFAYDAVYGADSTQQDVFAEQARPVLDAFLQGYNGTIIAYGQVRARARPVPTAHRSPTR